jgi:hypothetical protein
MMSSALTQLFRRPPGAGWLIVAGSPSPDEHIQRALALLEHAGCIAAVVPDPKDVPDAESALAPWLEISGWEGESIDCDSIDRLEEKVTEAGIILLPDIGSSDAYIRALGETDAGEFLLSELDGGGMIIAEGSAAEALGDAAKGEDMDSRAEAQMWIPALKWIPGAIIQSHFTTSKEFPIPMQRKDLFRIGLPNGVAFALGPKGEREIWGNQAPTITLREWWKP